MLMFLVVSPAVAEWQEVSKLDGTTTYIDTQSILKDGATVKAKVLLDRSSPFKNTAIMSYRNYLEYDCQAKRAKPIEMVGFSGQMATGTVLRTSSPPYEWSKSYPAGSPAETALKYACSQAGIAVETIAASNTSFDELFVGTFASETRENFGADQFGKYVIEITKKDDGYSLSYSTDGRPLFTIDVQKCSEESLKARYYHYYALPGELKALCGPRKSVQMFYAQNGIKISEQGPVKEATYKTQYYANVQWAIYGFKKTK
ncbi:surface-adhesin E family protein [Aromatoleum toluclasticum]|uniref:surface-adhesin E family protein n=1 Tax=Aromatoleum toluclasticum TaxID=92003 RepID=UPI0012F8E488|nr:surface-adhesin E family protein [Aromatoleum toluclasticum]